MIFKSTHMPLFTLYGRIFAPPEFVKVVKGLALPSPLKNYGLIVMLASAQRRRAARNARRRAVEAASRRATVRRVGGRGRAAATPPRTIRPLAAVVAT